MSIFSVKLTMRSPQPQLTLRLPPNHQSCWVYSLSANSRPRQSTTVSPTFDLGNINQLLSQSRLSSKAETFKNLFENFQSGSGPGGSGQLQLKQLQDTQSGSLGPATQLQQQMMVQLKQHIDLRFEEMEANIRKVIEEKDMVTQQRLDEIVQLLELKQSNS